MQNQGKSEYRDILVDLGLVVHESRVDEARQWLVNHIGRLVASGEIENWISVEPRSALLGEADYGWDKEE